MRRREVGRDAAPAGVVRSCTLGRAPGKPRRLLPGRLGARPPEKRKRKEVAGRAHRRGVLSLSPPVGAPTPPVWGGAKRWKAGGTPRPSQQQGPLPFGLATDCDYSAAVLITGAASSGLRGRTTGMTLSTTA